MAATLLILAGPSCVGKGPLLDALRRCHPDLPFGKPVVHTSRSPRPGERDGVDFHFHTADEIRALPPERYFVYPMRNQMRAIDLAEVAGLLREHPRVILELHPPRLAEFRQHAAVAEAVGGGRLVTILLQPLAPEEALAIAERAGVTPKEAVADVMLPKQVHRAIRLGQAMDSARLEDLRIRSAAAWEEMMVVDGVDHVLVNHDAEGASHWDHTPPIGDAGATLRAVAKHLSSQPGA